MHSRLKIHNSVVDFTEQTITRDEAVFKLQNKILQVLACLVSAHGQLVTVNALMDEVWSERVVSANTVQRCIAQLRKALGDSSSEQVVIKTYPKRGYALVAKVIEILPTSSDDMQVVASVEQTAASDNVAITNVHDSYKLKDVLPYFTAILGALILISLFTPSRPSKVNLQLNTVVTSSDANTSSAVYSPNGKLIAFQRFKDYCSSTIWLQNLSNKREEQLTQEQQKLGGISWSSDGTQLLTVASNPCFTPTHQQCWQMQKITLASATNQLKVTPLGTCEHKELSNIQWQSKKTALAIQRQFNGLRELVKIDVLSGLIVPFFNEGDIIVSTVLDHEKTALVTHNGSAHLELLIVNTSGRIIRRNELNYNNLFSIFNIIALRYLTKSQQLILETSGQLFVINEEGLLTPYADLTMDLSEFSFNKSEQTVTATRGRANQELYLLEQGKSTPSSFVTSKGNEYIPRISPTGVNMAFVSDRSGRNEVWISDGFSSEDVPYRLTQLPNITQINGMEWLPSGNTLIANVNDVLFTFGLDGTVTKIPSTVAIKYLHQVLNDHLALIEYQHEFEEVIAKIDLQTGALTPIYSGKVNDAKLDKQGHLWFTKLNSRLMRFVGTETTALVEQELIKGFRYLDEHIVATSKSGTVYTIDSKTGNVIIEGVTVPKNAWLQDVSRNFMVFGKTESKNSDIVMLDIEDL